MVTTFQRVAPFLGGHGRERLVRHRRRGVGHADGSEPDICRRPRTASPRTAAARASATMNASPVGILAMDIRFCRMNRESDIGRSKSTRVNPGEKKTLSLPFHGELEGHGFDRRRCREFLHRHFEVGERRPLSANTATRAGPRQILFSIARRTATESPRSLSEPAPAHSDLGLIDRPPPSSHAPAELAGADAHARSQCPMA